MPYTIDVQSTQRFSAQLAQVVAQAAHEALTHASALDGAALTILLTNDKKNETLNTSIFTPNWPKNAKRVAG